MGYSDAGCFGGEIHTPNLDRLAAEGLRFTQFYNTARCWPSRAALLTGYYAQQVNRDPARKRPAWAPLLPDLLRAGGYHSYHSGKWHIDGQALTAGFGRSYQVTDHDRHLTPKSHVIDDKPAPPPGPGEKYYSTSAIAERGIEWLAEHDAQHRGEPFFLYLAFTAPHFPLQALPEDIERYRSVYRKGWDEVRRERWRQIQKLGLVAGGLSDPEPTLVPSWNLPEAELQARIGSGEMSRAVPWKELTSEQQEFQADKMAVHAAMIDCMDREIGRVLDKIQQMNALNNTLVFFASDNGASAEQIIRGDGHKPGAKPGSAESFLGLGPGWSTVANTPFRRHKSWVHEGGISTPMIVCWPAGIAARGELRHAPGHLVDIAPTLLELTGIAAPAKWNDQPRPTLPGRSLVPLFKQDSPVKDEVIFFKHMENRGLRVGNWKIVASGTKTPWELYDLANDRAESHNLAAEKPERVAELSALWNQRDAEYTRQGASK